MQKLKLIKKQFIKIGAPILSALTLVGCKTVTIDVNAELAKNGYVNEFENDDRYIKVNYNPDYREVVHIDSEVLNKPVNIYNGLKEIKEYDNLKQAKEILYNIPELDDDYTDENKYSNINNYLYALDLINENNPLLHADIIKYANNYENELYSYDRYNDVLLTYEAISYHRLLNNNVNLAKALDELEKLYQSQDTITTTDDYPLLTSTLNNGENLEDLYLPLAYDLHRISCSKEHEKENNNFKCKTKNTTF